MIGVYMTPIIARYFFSGLARRFAIWGLNPLGRPSQIRAAGLTMVRSAG